MRGIRVLFLRECRSAFDSPVAYIFLIAWTVICLLVLRNEFYEDGQATLRLLFSQTDGLLFILVPALAMRFWAEESRSGTLQLLLTWPVTLGQIVLAKFLAGAALLAVALGLLLPMTLIIAKIGPLDPGPVIVGFLGSWLLASAYLAVACAVSSVTSSQVVAYIVSLIACGVLWLIGEPALLKFWSVQLIPLVEGIGFGSRFRHFEYGLVRLADVMYYLSWIVVSLTATRLLLLRHRRPGT